MWPSVRESAAQTRLERLLIGHATPARIAVIACGPLAVAAWLLMAPGWVLSREMTWDLLFNLAGAWHLEQGHVLHVDFHDPLGILGFQLTRIGFLVVGHTVRAFLVGQLIAAASLFAVAVYAAHRRLPVLPATLFVWYATLLVLLPTNLGEQMNAYSFAMSYNRWGWSGLLSLLVVLFIEPRRGGWRAWLEPAVSGALILFLFYVKATYALAGLAALILALWRMPHIRGSWRPWTVMLIATSATMLMPVNYPYLADLRYALTSGYARGSGSHLITFLDNRRELTLWAIGVMALLWMWVRQYVRFDVVLASVFILGLGLLVLSQNAQVRDIPVGMVIYLMVYVAVRRAHGKHAWPTRELTVVLAASCVALMSSIVSHSVTLAGYHRAASRNGDALKVTTTNLRGLAVPLDEKLPDLSPILRHQFLGLVRPPSRDRITQQQYVESLLEAASYLQRSGEGGARTLVLDQVNPLPFVLGAPPPKGGSLWLWAETPPRAAEAIFGDVDIVLVPKYANDPSSAVFALSTYASYVGEHFRIRTDTPRWTILRRPRE